MRKETIPRVEVKFFTRNIIFYLHFLKAILHFNKRLFVEAGMSVLFSLANFTLPKFNFVVLSRSLRALVISLNEAYINLPLNRSLIEGHSKLIISFAFVYSLHSTKKSF